MIKDQPISSNETLEAELDGIPLIFPNGTINSKQNNTNHIHAEDQEIKHHWWIQAEEQRNRLWWWYTPSEEYKKELGKMP